jgi:hypothetical protein
MSEPPQPSWQGDHPNDPTAPLPPTPPASGPPASDPAAQSTGQPPTPPEPPSYGPPASGPPSYGPPPSGAPSYGPPSSGVPSYGPPSSGAPSYGPPDQYGPPGAPPPYGQPNPYAAQPQYGQPGQPGPYPPPGGYPGQPVPGQPYPGAPGYPGVPPQKKSNAGKIALIIGAVVLVLLCACGGVAIWLVSQAENRINETIDSLPTADPTRPPTAAPPTFGPTEDFNKGDCVINSGTDADPDLSKVACATGTLEVIAEIPFSLDQTMCDNDFLGAGKGKYDLAYTHDQTPGSLGDFVLCLKKR